MHEQLRKCGASTPQSQNYYRSKFSRDNSRQTLPSEFLSLRRGSLSPNINCSISRSYGQESLRSASIGQNSAIISTDALVLNKASKPWLTNLRCRRPWCQDERQNYECIESRIMHIVRRGLSWDPHNIRRHLLHCSPAVAIRLCLFPILYPTLLNPGGPRLCFANGQLHNLIRV